MEWIISKTPDGQFELKKSTVQVVGTFADIKIAAEFVRFMGERILDDAPNSLDVEGPSVLPEEVRPASTEPASEESKPTRTEWTSDELDEAYKFCEMEMHRAVIAAQFDAYWSDLQSATVAKIQAEKRFLDAAIQATSDEQVVAPSELENQIPAEDAPQPSECDEWTPAELDQAFDMLAQGEKMRVVADRFGKSWTKLRRKWAPQKKRYVQADTNTGSNLPVQVEQVISAGDLVTSAVKMIKDQRPCTMCGQYFSITPDHIDTCGRVSCAA